MGNFIKLKEPGAQGTGAYRHGLARLRSYMTTGPSCFVVNLHPPTETLELVSPTDRLRVHRPLR